MTLVIGYGAAFSLRTPDFTHDLGRPRQVVWCALTGLVRRCSCSRSPGAALQAATGEWDLADVLRGLGSPNVAYLFVAVGFTGSILDQPLVRRPVAAGRGPPGDPPRARCSPSRRPAPCSRRASFDDLMLSWLTVMALAAPGLVAVCVIHTARRERVDDGWRVGGTRRLGGRVRVRYSVSTWQALPLRSLAATLRSRPLVYWAEPTSRGAGPGGRDAGGLRWRLTKRHRRGAVPSGSTRTASRPRAPCGGTSRRPRSTSTRSTRATASWPRAAPLVVSTGAHTGRAPKDKFVVREPGSEGRVWWGDSTSRSTKPTSSPSASACGTTSRAGDALRHRRLRRRRPARPPVAAPRHRERLARPLRPHPVHRARRRAARGAPARGPHPPRAHASPPIRPSDGTRAANFVSST